MIEKLVTNLEVSKKLKELGVLQESWFYWVEYVWDEQRKCELIDNKAHTCLSKNLSHHFLHEEVMR